MSKFDSSITGGYVQLFNISFVKNIQTKNIKFHVHLGYLITVMVTFFDLIGHLKYLERSTVILTSVY